MRAHAGFELRLVGVLKVPEQVEEKMDELSALEVSRRRRAYIVVSQ